MVLLRNLVRLMPYRFRWAPHNLIAHPAREILGWFGLDEIGERLHEATLPGIE